jgi:DNA-binding transcriptional LysR family regulator
MDDLADILKFVQVAELKSFSAAAAKLGMPASTLSRRISELEARMGTKLLLRTTRRVALTEAGALLLSRGRDVAEAARSIREEISDYAATPRGRVRVSLTPDFGTRVLASIIAQFSRTHPELEIILDLTPSAADLMSGDVDVAFRIGLPQKSSYVVRKIAEARQGLFAAPDFFADAAPLTEPLQLAALPVLAVGLADSARHLRLSRGTETVAVEVSSPVAANTPSMILNLAAAGLGIAAADELIASSLVRTGALVPVLPDWSLPPVSVFAVTASKLPPLRVRLFIDHIQQALKSSR